jgi:hypothetical protein
MLDGFVNITEVDQPPIGPTRDARDDHNQVGKRMSMITWR